VIAPFAFFNFEGATLDALIVKLGMITYAVMFSYIALVGRLVFVIHKTTANGGMDKSNAHLVTNRTESNAGTKLGVDAKVLLCFFISCRKFVAFQVQMLNMPILFRVI
jgi:hypothetical protein